MADFPSLIASSRTWTPGEYPYSLSYGMAGLESRVKMSNVKVAGTLTLSFIGLDESEMLSIVDHYVGQRGGFDLFSLPDVIFSGADNPSTFTEPGYAWRYAEPPQVEDSMCGWHSAEVTLQTAPIPAVLIAGAWMQVGVFFTPADAPVVVYDADAQAYITAVESADGQSLESSVKTAVIDFVIGCKSDGIWADIQASCILAGARTLTGALTPLKGSAPTNNNFITADYNRETGLMGNGSSKYINSNRSNDADSQDSKHAAIYVSVLPTVTARPMLGLDRLNTEGPGATLIYDTLTRLHDTTTSSYTAPTGFIGLSRSASGSYTRRSGGADTTESTTSSTTPLARDVVLFADTLQNAPIYSNARIAFYSIGSSVDLALLDARVSTLMTDLAAAIT